MKPDRFNRIRGERIMHSAKPHADLPKDMKQCLCYNSNRHSQFGWQNVQNQIITWSVIYRQLFQTIPTNQMTEATEGALLPKNCVYTIPSQSDAEHQIAVPHDWTWRRLRNAIVAHEHLKGFYQLYDGDNLLDDSKEIRSMELSSGSLRVVEVPLKSTNTGTLRLRDRKSNKYFYVNVYLDETIGEVKSLLKEKHFSDMPPEMKILISPQTAAQFEDVEPIWNLDLKQVYSLHILPPEGSTLQDGRLITPTPPGGPPDFDLRRSQCDMVFAVYRALTDPNSGTTVPPSRPTGIYASSASAPGPGRSRNSQ
jgi:hypothetical protein